MTSLSIRKGTTQARDSAKAAQELYEALRQPDIKFAVFYCAADFDLPSLANELHKRFGDINLIGCTTAGEITPQGYLAGALTGVSIASPHMDAATQLVPLDPFDSVAAGTSVNALVQGLGMRDGLPAGPTDTFGFMLIDGLAISKNIMELMGGDISVESQLGLGSRFECRLPCASAADSATAAAGSARRAPPSDRLLTGLRILIAEDDPSNQDLLAVTLGDEGATTVIAQNGREAVERVRSDGPRAYDVVLMDVQMPEMDGYEATREIHRLAPFLPIIGQTAHALTEERKSCLAAGMVAYVAKPLDLEALVNLVRQHTGRAARG